MGRLRPADGLVLLAALAALGSLFLDWLAPAQTGWDALGWATLALIVLTAAIGLLMIIQLARGARDALNLPPGVFLAALTPLAFLVTLVVMLTKLGGRTTLDSGGWVGLSALGILTLGAWLSLKDERTDQPSRQVAPPAPRPAPPAS